MSDIDRENLLKLSARRVDLLRELSFIDNEIRDIQAKLNPPPTKSERTYLCKCGRKFQYFLERLTHLTDYIDDTIHADDGEIIDGKHIQRNYGIVGDPIKSKQAQSKWAKTARIDVDDIA